MKRGNSTVGTGITVGIALVAGASSTNIVAAETPDSGPASLQEVVVTAQRRAELSKDVPVTMTVLSASELEKSGITNTRDLTTVVPGLVFTGLGVAAQPSIRGVSASVSTPGAPGPVAIYVDGIYQSSQIGNYLDLPDAERIEVLKGPQGTLYGRNATAGAILITTRGPSYTPTGTISIADGALFGGSANTANHFQSNVFLAGPILDHKLAGSVSASFEDMPGFMTDDMDGSRTGKIQSFQVRGKLQYDPTEDLRILLAGSYSSRRDDTTFASYPLLSVGSQYPGAVLPTQPWHVTSELGGASYQKTTGDDVSLTIDWTQPGVGTWTSRTGYTEVQPLVNGDVDASYSPACIAAYVCITPYADWQPDYTFQQELSYASVKWGRFSFIGGLMYLHDSEVAFYNVNPAITHVPINTSGPYGYYVWQEVVTTNASSAYLEGTYDLSDKLSAIVGGRYSFETKDEWARQAVFTFAYPTGPFTPLPPGGAPDDHAFTPKVALRYALTPESNLFAAYNRGFKSGVLTALSMTAPPAKPETINSYEVGFKHAGERYSLDASAFYFDYSDMQVQFFDGLSTFTKNAASAKSYGFDLSGVARVTEDWRLNASLSWIPYAKYEDFPNGVDFAPPLTPAGLQQIVVDASGTRLLRDPKFTASLTADYQTSTSLGRLDASLTGYYSSAYNWDLLGRVQTDAYATLAGQLSLTPTHTSVQLSLYGKNLTNKTVIVSESTTAQGDTAAFMQPREVGLRATYTF
jgi:iron complex outermembrane recepter protein